METLKNCPLCEGSGPFENHVECRDYLVSQEVFSVHRCETCGFIFTNPRPVAEEMPQFYQSDDYISHAENPVSMQDKVYMKVKQLMLKRKLHILKKHLKDSFIGNPEGFPGYKPGGLVTPPKSTKQASKSHSQEQGDHKKKDDPLQNPKDDFLTGQQSIGQHANKPPCKTRNFQGSIDASGKDGIVQEENANEKSIGASDNNAIEQEENATSYDKGTALHEYLLLDYGCGTGSFLKAARDAGINAMGFEPEPSARGVAAKHGVRVIGSESEMNSFSDQAFHAITLWHVIEHLHDFKQILKIFYRLLKPGGVLLMAAPMANSKDATIYREYWAAWDLPRHILHFTPNTLQRAGEDAGFEYLENKPLPFDAWYIALLSEQNKLKEKEPGETSGGATIFTALKAAVKGSWSNLKATTGSSPWSSQTFVFRRSEPQKSG